MTELRDIRQQRKFKILLLGDICLDRYIYGSVERISPEAPVPIFVPKRTFEQYGMSSNVYENLTSLGAKVTFKHGEYSTKTRYIEEKSKYQMLRVDDDVTSKKFNLLVIDKYDAIVVSDYNKGFVDYDTVTQLRQSFDCPIFIDSKKKDLAKFEGCFVKINELEYNNATSYPSDLIVTLGAKGSMYKEKIYPTKSVEVHDVTGAGDVFLASLCMFYLHTKSIEAAIEYANKLASISVQHECSYIIQQSDLHNL
jgi:bifunctional ADP-heptose synthase (sugar kinase/adenylyltransferase)